LWAYLIAVGMIVVVTVIGKLLVSLPIFNSYNAAILYVLCVTISAAYLGAGPSLAASFLSTMGFDFFFIPPVMTFTVASEQDGLSLLILLAVTIAISCLSPSIRR
jgi:two-component system, OmpR family, sensor histidine kinase KdpD